MKIKYFITLVLVLMLSMPMLATTSIQRKVKKEKKVLRIPSLHPDSIYHYSAPKLKKYPWRAAAEVVGINGVIWSFNKLTGQPFAEVTAESIRNNFKTGFVWDNDWFSVNMMGHPYNGSLYYNAARSSGLNFWQSAPYTVLGSLLWEFTGECEPPSINDVLATTFGGVALGEMTHRLSALMLDDSKRGFNRFGRELLGLGISPIRGFNRLITGEMWKYKPVYYKYHNYDRIPVDFSLGAGSRFLSNSDRDAKDDYGAYIDLYLKYGDACNEEENKPYDYFSTRLSFVFTKSQPIFNQINLLAKLWGMNLTKSSSRAEAMFGIFQHFNYMNTEEIVEGSGVSPYKLSETTSFGAGLICRIPNAKKTVTLEEELHVSGILLGGSSTDYYRVLERDYNMGSGYSIKNGLLMNFNNRSQLKLNVGMFHLFTWKGYDPADLETVDHLYLNSQGDKGNTIYTLIDPMLAINLIPELTLNLSMTYYHRRTAYAEHERMKMHTFESKLGIYYRF